VFHRLCRRAPVLLVLLLRLVPGVHAAECKLARIAELPVTMNGLQPTFTAQINGTDAVFTLDSGAFWSVLSPASAAQYKLHLDHNRLPGFYMRGIGGNVDVAVTTVKTFTIFDVPLHNVDFIVGGSDVGEGSVGVLGQNLLRIADVEYDLGDGAMRLFRPTGCRKANLAYWVKPGSSYSEMPIDQPTPAEPHTVGIGYLNGAKLRITFDSGAQISVVGLRAAASAGIKPDSPGVQPAGVMSGFGKSAVRTWIATFPVLKIGDEEVHNARLHFGDLGIPDMLLGSDFFLSHRIYVASSQGKLYFTYNGGPVFNLNPPHNAQAAAKEPATADDGATPEPPLSAATDSADAKEPAKDSTPADAAAIARHAAALAARRDFEQALQEYNRACELAPAEPTYYYQRARVRLNLRQADPAASDLDEALKLKPDYLDAVVARAELDFFKKNRAAGLTDLETADRLAAKESDIRLTLAGLYERADSPEQAVTQLDLWIPLHSQDVRLPHALNERCWNRALAGRQLDLALDDCNAGLRIAHSPQLLDSRGLVYLRSGKLDKAIADYNAALKINPRIAWSLYGRGVAEMRKGMTSQGEADMAAAAAIAPRLSETAKKIGLLP
jgi:tetratricopeptide (TPR) repeat protein/predicted aspartyl protease